MRLQLHSDLIEIKSAAGDDTEPAREIAGLAVPWNVEAAVSTGQLVKFLPGSLPLDGPAPKFVRDHDLGQPLGIVAGRSADSTGMWFTAKVSKTRAGDEALVLAGDGVLDSVSVAVDVIDYEMDGPVTVVKSASWRELSLLAFGAFDQAKISSVAASEPDPTPTNPEEDPEVDNNNNNVEVEAATVPTAPIVFAAPKKLRLPSPGEYLAAMRAGGADFAQLNANIQAATGDVLVSDAAGVIPTPIVGPVINDVQALRPVVSALGVRAMPEAGASFIRPYVKVHSAAGEQSTELTALSTADFEVDDIVISKKTFGGKLVLSEQVIDWSSPSMLDAAISDMAGQYALKTEKEAVDVMAAAITNSQEVINTTSTSASEFIADLYTAASGIASTGNYLPNALVVSPAKWAVLGSLVDGQNRPLFPQAAPMNSVGTLGGVTSWNGNPLGLQLVVSNQVGAQTIGNKTATEYYWLLNTRGVEVYEQYKGFIRDESVGSLAVTVAVRGYFAAKVVDVNMIRIIGPDATF